MNPFEEFIHTLSIGLNLPLTAEKGILCKLQIDEKLSLYLQYDEANDLLLIGCLVGEIPPGKFRENVLKEALKQNAYYPRIANLCYTEKGNKLAFYTHKSFERIDAQTASHLIESYIAYGMSWHTAIQTGNLSMVIS